MKKKYYTIPLSVILAFSLMACGTQKSSSTASGNAKEEAAVKTMENTVGGEHAITADGENVSYSDITVSDASLTSTKSEGVVVEGKNSVTLHNVELSAGNTEHNSEKPDKQTYKGTERDKDSENS
ncbi:hypothetical protein SAMN02910358_01644 [Lachnospiraceae bacterium XBB1006]|nr:hypothetical protein SAMN02910358_01644 [Lachnospiraceae bacterium XBB1006]